MAGLGKASQLVMRRGMAREGLSAVEGGGRGCEEMSWAVGWGKSGVDEAREVGREKT